MYVFYLISMSKSQRNDLAIYICNILLYILFTFIHLLLIFRKSYAFLFRKSIDKSARVNQCRAALRRIAQRNWDYRFINLFRG